MKLYATDNVPTVYIEGPVCLKTHQYGHEIHRYNDASGPLHMFVPLGVAIVFGPPPPGVATCLGEGLLPEKAP